MHQNDGGARGRAYRAKFPGVNLVAVAHDLMCNESMLGTVSLVVAFVETGQIHWFGAGSQRSDQRQRNDG